MKCVKSVKKVYLMYNKVTKSIDIVTPIRR
nr:MAG TPA_asm: hypothetical protein [Bacteriophage sp.]